MLELLRIPRCSQIARAMPEKTGQPQERLQISSRILKNSKKPQLSAPILTEGQPQSPQPLLPSPSLKAAEIQPPSQPPRQSLPPRPSLPPGQPLSPRWSPQPRQSLPPWRSLPPGQPLSPPRSPLPGQSPLLEPIRPDKYERGRSCCRYEASSGICEIESSSDESEEGATGCFQWLLRRNRRPGLPRSHTVGSNPVRNFFTRAFGSCFGLSECTRSRSLSPGKAKDPCDLRHGAAKTFRAGTLCNNLCADSLQRAEGKRAGNGGVASWVICWADDWGEWGLPPRASITFSRSPQRQSS